MVAAGSGRAKWRALMALSAAKVNSLNIFLGMPPQNSSQQIQALEPLDKAPHFRSMDPAARG